MTDVSNGSLSVSEMRQINGNTLKLGQVLARWWALNKVHSRYEMEDFMVSPTLVDEKRNIHALRVCFQWLDVDSDDSDDGNYWEITLDASTLHREEEQAQYNSLCDFLTRVEKKHSAARQAEKAKAIKQQLDAILTEENIELLKAHGLKPKSF